MFNGKYICIKSTRASTDFTEGEIYEFTDGAMTYNDGRKGLRYFSFEDYESSTIFKGYLQAQEKVNPIDLLRSGDIVETSGEGQWLCVDVNGTFVLLKDSQWTSIGNYDNNMISSIISSFNIEKIYRSSRVGGVRFMLEHGKSTNIIWSRESYNKEEIKKLEKELEDNKENGNNCIDSLKATAQTVVDLNLDRKRLEEKLDSLKTK